MHSSNPDILVLIPTYKRLEQLRWVIKSLVRCRLPALNKKPRVIIINNYPSVSIEVEKLVSKVIQEEQSSQTWEICVFKRTESLPPVTNWFDALEKFAKNDDVVFFLGDDDIVTADYILIKYELILKSKAEMILSKITTGLYFSDSDNILSITFNKKYYEKAFFYSTIPDLLKYNAVHISNHCYRYNSTFQQSIRQVFEWINKVNYIDFKDTSLFITLFLPISLLLNNSKSVAIIDTPLIFRGTSIDDIKNSKFGVPGWNTGYISFIASLVLDEQAFHLDSRFSSIYNDMYLCAASWYYAIKFDNRIDTHTKEMVLAKLDEIIKEKKYKKSIRLIIAEWFGLKAITLRIRRLQNKTIRTEDFLNQIHSNEISY